MEKNKNPRLGLWAKAVICMIAAVCTVFAAIGGAAAAETRKSCDVVVLMDVSGSMKTADPFNEKIHSRVTLEAMEAFPAHFKTDAFSKINLSVVLYNSDIFTLLSDVNVKTESGDMKLGDRINELRSNEYRPQIEGYTFYYGQTNIEAAMKEAEAKLSKSNADVKAIILFTDGKIELQDTAENEASRGRTIELGKKLGEQGVHIYCIGLGRPEDVDESLLQTLAENADGSSALYSNKNAIFAEFGRIATVLAGGAEPDPVPEPDPIVIKPDVPTLFETDIYGGIISEANITLSADVPINSLKIIDPSGKTVASLNLKNGEVTSSSDDCVIRATSTRATVNVKLINPMDGMWKVEFLGEMEGSAIVHAVSYYELDTVGDVPAQTFVDTPVSGTAAIFNSTAGVNVTTKRVYAESVMNAYLVKKGTDEAVAKVTASVDPSGEKFGYTFTADEPGDFEVVFEIHNDRFNTKLVKRFPIHIDGATFEISADRGETERGTGVNLTGKFLVNGAPCSVVPKYLSGASIRISMSKDGVIYHPHGSESLIDWLNNTNNFTFDNMGEYTFTAEILRGEEVMVVSNPVTVKALPSVITLAGDLDTDLSAVLKGDPFESAIVLDGLFEDSDKDPVTVTVAEASEGIEAVKQGNQIVIRAEKTVNGVVRLLASDGHGAEKTVEIHVSVKSVADIVIPIVIGAAVLLVLVVVALVIVRKNSIVSFSFSVSTVVNYKTYTFNIQNYRNKKNAKPKVTLKTLLDVCSFCVAGDESAAKAAFAPLASRITVKGKPFKKAFVIFVDGKKVCEYERNRERDVWVGNDGDVVTFGPV